MEPNGGIAVNKSCLVYIKDWDLADSNNGLAKLQHKLQQKVHTKDTKLENGCVGMRSSHMWHPS